MENMTAVEAGRTTDRADKNDYDLNSLYRAEEGSEAQAEESAVKAVDVFSHLEFTPYVPAAEDLAREYQYYLAHETISLLLKKGLISLVEFDDLERKFRRKFYPHLAPVLPELSCYVPLSEQTCYLTEGGENSETDNRNEGHQN